MMRFTLTTVELFHVTTAHGTILETFELKDVAEMYRDILDSRVPLPKSKIRIMLNARYDQRPKKIKKYPVRKPVHFIQYQGPIPVYNENWWEYD